MSNDGPRCGHAHRRALDVPARPARARSPCPTTARPASGPSTGRSRGRRPCRTRRPRPAPRPAAARDRAGRAGRTPATTRSGRRSSRRRSGRRGRARAASRSGATISSMCSVARGRTSGGVIRSAAASARNRSSVAVGELARCRSPAAAAPRMILSSMSVMFMTQVTAEPAPAQVADEQVGEQERPEVADVGRAVDRRAAAVDAGRGRARAARAAASRPVSVSCSRMRHRAALRRSRRPSARSTRPAPSVAVEVAGRRLDVDRAAGRGRAARAIASRIASRCAAEPRPRGDDRQVDRRRAPAGRREPRDDRREQLAAGDAARRRGVGREQPAEVAQPGRAQQRVGDRVERDVAVGVAVQPRARRRSSMPPSASGAPGPNGWLSCPIPVRRATRPTRRERGLDAAQVGGQGHLEVARVAGDGMNRDATGLQQGGLIGPRLRAVRREAREGARSRPGATPCGVWAAARTDRSTVATMSPSVDPLEGLGDGQDRDRGAMLGGGRRRRPSTSAGDDERPRAVVDEDDPRSSARPVERSRAANAGGHRILARVAAGDDRDDPRRQPRRAARARPPGRRDVTRTIRSTHGAARSRPGSRRAAAGRRSARAACPCRPSGAMRPAATTIGVGGSARPRAPLNRGAAGRRSSGRRRSGGPG